MGLFTYEGRKLLRNPLTLVLLAVLLVAGLAQPLYDVYQYRTVNQTYQDRNIEQIIAEYEKMSYSPLLTSMSGSEYQALADERENQERVVPDELLVYFDTPINQYFSLSNVSFYRENGYALSEVLAGASEGSDRLRCVQSLKRAMNTLVRNGQRDSYEYLVLKKQVDMMEAAGVTGVQYNHFWVELEETTSGITLPLAAVLVLLLSGAFSREYDTGMYRILTATPMGKRRSMFCKVGISLLLGVGTALLALLLPAAVYLGLGTPEGWNSPLSQLGEGWFTYTPYDLQVWQYFLYKLLFVCLGMAAVALMASFFSLLTRSALYASTVSLLLLFTAYGALFVTDTDTVFSWFSLTYALNPRMIFSDYVSFWLPGDGILLYPDAMIIFLVVLSGLFLLLIWLWYSRCWGNRSHR